MKIKIKKFWKITPRPLSLKKYTREREKGRQKKGP